MNKKQHSINNALWINDITRMRINKFLIFNQTQNYLQREIKECKND